MVQKREGSDEDSWEDGELPRAAESISDVGRGLEIFGERAFGGLAAHINCAHCSTHTYQDTVV